MCSDGVENINPGAILSFNAGSVETQLHEFSFSVAAHACAKMTFYCLDSRYDYWLRIFPSWLETLL